MLRQINRVLNIIVGVVAGVLIGRGICVYWDFRTHPDVYAVQSAPWYTSILTDAIFCLIAIVVCLVIKWIIRGRIK